MIKRVVSSLLILVIFSVSITGCKRGDEVKSKKKEDFKPKATVEACEFLSEWDSSLYEVFGFEGLQLPYNAHNPKIEKGRTYIKTEFSVDDDYVFENFFKLIYVVMWGEISDIKQIVKEEGDICSFEGDYIVTEIYRDATAVKSNVGKRSEKYAFIKISYSKVEHIVKMECRLLKEPRTKVK